MRQSEGMSPELTEAIRKQAEQWIGEMEHTPDEVQAMLAGMKYRVSPGSFSPPSTLYL